ncbi:OmpA family protein [Roseovarius sp. EL26]|uniref:OmpA family protein n=1 Tax=Roseovarius sp. EL26 TaxID=2126672 RepID=UPI000EA38412|nr:OmpA family protein [Roseovarius sp. EL26]
MTRARNSMTIVAGISALLVAGCTDPGQLGGTNPNQKAQTGAILGGLVGAGAGAVLSDDKAKGAIIGGVLGAAGGAVYGNYLDKQEAELRQNLDSQDIQITNTGDRLILTMPEDVLFNVDSATVSPVLRGDLTTVARSLQDYPDSSVQVIGHTDNTGSADHNQNLSERRANAVSDVLHEGGVPYNRVQSFGRGEDQPVASNLTDEGRAQNRRVDIVILPNAT